MVLPVLTEDQKRVDAIGKILYQLKSGKRPARCQKPKIGTWDMVHGC